MLNDAEKLNEIIRLGSELNTIEDIDILLERILFEARVFTNADAGSIYISDGKFLTFRHVQNDTQQKKLARGENLPYSVFKVIIDHSSIAGYVASTGKILNIPDVYNLDEKSPFKFDSEYDDFTDYKTKSMLTVPLVTFRGSIVGVLQIINTLGSDGQIEGFNQEDEAFVQHFGNIASIVVQRAQKTRTLILRMINMAQLRDPKETGAHVNRVASYSVELYEKWSARRNLPQSEIEQNRDILRIAAMLHDVGKVGISDLILKKPGKLTDEEFEIMKAHTCIGADLFQDDQSEFDIASSVVAMTHHENWDGTGYPRLINTENGLLPEGRVDGDAIPLKGEDIPIFGRIVALADVFDALSSKRVYKDAWDEKSVLAEIRKLSGKKFDPELVDIFFDYLDQFRAISERYPDKE